MNKILTSTLPRLLLAMVLLMPTTLAAQEAEQSQLDFANGLFSRSFYKDAAVEYNTYLTKYPEGKERETALYRLGESQYAEKNFKDALEAFNQVRKQFPTGTYTVRSKLREGASHYRLGQLNKARPILKAVANQETDQQIKGEALYYLGKLNTDAKQWDAATKAYERLSNEAPNSAFAPFGQYQLAAVYVGQGKLEKAALIFITIGDDQNATPPMQMDALYRAGESYDKLGWHEAAVRSYEKLKTRFPKSDYARRADYGLAWSLYRSGKYDQAITSINAFVKQYPNSKLKNGLDYLKGNCYLKKKDHPKAESLFQAVIDQHPGTEHARQAQYKMAISLIEHDQGAAAREILIPMTRVKPANATTGDATFLLATLHMDAQEYAEAALQFLRVVEQYPNSEFHVESLYKLGESYALTGDLKQSALTFEQFARENADHILALEAVFHSADAYFQQKNYEQALVRFEHVARDAKQSRFREEAMYRMAISYYNLKNFTAGKAAFNSLLKDFPESRYQAEAHYRIGDFLLYEKNNAVDAIEHFKKVTNKFPKSPFKSRALKGIAVAHYTMKDFDGAVEVFYRLITNHTDFPLDATTYEWVGQHLFDREEWKQSTDVFTALINHIKDYPNPERIQLKLGEAYTALDNPKKALEAYAWIQEYAPKTLSAHESTFRTAGVYEKQGKTDRAIELYEQAADAAMNDTAAQARFRLGEIFEEKKDYDTAARNYMRVAILFFHPTLSPESMWRAGQCFEYANNPDSAIKTYNDIVQEYPDSDQAIVAKERLSELKVQKA